MLKLRGLYSLGAVAEAALPFLHGLAVLSACAAFLAALVAAFFGSVWLAGSLLAYAILTLLLQVWTRMRYVLAIGDLRLRRGTLQIQDRKKGEWVDALSAGLARVWEREESESSPFGPFSYELPAFDFTLRDGRVITHLSANAHMHGVAFDALRAIGVRVERKGPGFEGARASSPFRGLGIDEANSRELAAAYFAKVAAPKDNSPDKPYWGRIVTIAAVAALLIFLIFLVLEVPGSLPVVDIPTSRKGKRGFDGAVVMLLASVVLLFFVRGGGKGKYVMLAVQLAVGLALLVWTVWLTLRWQGVIG